MKSKEITTTKFAIFKGTKVRKVIFQNEWWFWLKGGYFEMSENIGQLKLIVPDGKSRETDCTNIDRLKGGL